MTGIPATTKTPTPPHQNGAETLCIMVPLPLTSGYDYLAPKDVPAPQGSIVEVMLGSRPTIGVVWGPGCGSIALEKLKPIGCVRDDIPPLPTVSVDFINWVSRYTVTPAGALLKMVLGGQLRPLKPKDTLNFPTPDPDGQKIDLTDEQNTAAKALIEAVQADAFSVTLLDGVTGSGKTEVYSEAIAAAFRQGRQALVLLPEIAMTAALIDRLTKRFGVRPTLWHSGLSEKERRLNWNAIARGQAQFVLGARSALFLPYPDLGLIVVDEEHEAAFKQEEGVIYHGRDMAVVRAHLGGIPVVLASATPSLETLHNVQKGKYRHIRLHSRFGAAGMPHIKLIDLRIETLPSQNFISTPLFDALTAAVADGKQAMLFLNRRGYAPLTLCRGCGHRMQCPHCTSWLIEHKRTNRLHCHHCGYAVPIPKTCPTCGEADKFAACGPGIERIALELAARAPQIRTSIMASDTMDGPEGAKALVEQMDNHDIDVLIGTQIMAKGYHFPRLVLVGVVDADLGLSGGDPRVAEHTFQLLQQVAGRSGRADDPGTVMLQTVMPDHPVMQALVKGNRDAFLAAEMRERQAYHLPPFSRLANITLSGGDGAAVRQAAEAIARAAPQDRGLKILGPAQPPFAILRGKTRYRLLVEAPDKTPLSSVIASWVGSIKLPRTIKLQVDIDPYSFL